MLQLSEYDIYFFDCDGVILDSNALKIAAMENVLSQFDFKKNEVNSCITYFKKNFGKSRFHHVDYFLSNILCVSSTDRSFLEQKLLNLFSIECKELYKTAPLTPGYLDFARRLEGKKYVASGSAEDELRDVFSFRKLSNLYDGIFGSPKHKSQILKDLLTDNNSTKALMIGDAKSDFLAAQENGIDFLAYLPFSNVPNEMKKLAIENNFSSIMKWSEA